MDNDSKIHYLFQPNPWTDPNTSHPPTAAHAAMVYGDATHASMADWIEDQMGWGTTGALFPYNSWASNTAVDQTESLTVQSFTGPTHRVITWTGFTNGSGTIIDATAVGNQVTYVIPGVTAGVYDIRVGCKNLNTRGIWQLAIGPAGSTSPTNLGAPQDEYATGETFAEYDLGNWTPGSSSDKWFTFTVTGKNAASTGYTISFDYIKLIHR